MGGDRTNWSRVLDQMPATFTVAQFHAATGATDFVYDSESVMPDVITVAAKAYDCGGEK